MARSVLAPCSTGFRLMALLSGVLILLFVSPESAEANVLPDALVYFDVDAVEYAYPDCEVDVWGCEQMQQTTPNEDLVRFRIYIEQTYGDPVTTFTADMTWPDEWWLYTGAFCEGGEGTLDYWGPNPHRLEVHFPCDNQPYLFLALDLFFVVNGYGKLTTDNARVWIGCPPQGWETEAASMFGEAGPGCEYTNQPCDYSEFACEPHFAEDELILTAVTGGSTRGEVPFSARWGSEHQYGCGHTWGIETGDAWCSGKETPRPWPDASS